MRQRYRHHACHTKAIGLLPGTKSCEAKYNT